MADIITSIQHFLLRAFLFPRSAQLRLLSALKVQLNAGISLSDAMTYQRRLSKDHQVQRVADLAMSSISIGNPFSSLFAEEGYFAARDARLLDIADRHGFLVEAIDLLSAESLAEDSFSGNVFFANAQWIMGVISMLIITMYGTSYEDIMTFGNAAPQTFFVVGAWLNANLWWVGLLAIAGVVGYFTARNSLGGDLRLQVREMGLFVAGDYQIQIRLLKLMSTLLKNGVPVREAVEESVMMVKADAEKHLTISLENVLNALRVGDSLHDGLKYLLTESHIVLLRLQSGRDTPQELSQSLATLAEVITGERRSYIKGISLMVAVLSAFGAFALLVPMINMLMGAGLTEY